MRPLEFAAESPKSSVNKCRNHRKEWVEVQLKLATSLVVRLSSVKHVDSVLESDLDDILCRISTNLGTDGEPWKSNK